MSRHTIELNSDTPSGKAIVVIGYDITGGPHFFCWFHDALSNDKFTWSSIQSQELCHAQSPTDFDSVLSDHGIVLPDFIYKALGEDWAKNLLNCDYCWFEDGSFEQIR
tara:strand:+ start:6920 stop:7243 length:324 start_codon:yes stop_codon:yes gene_type:complete